MKKYKFLILPFIVILLLSSYFYLINKNKKNISIGLSVLDTTNLEKDVRGLILYKYKNWNEKIEISSTNSDNSAVKGFWYYKDRWDWIAYKNQNKEWVTLISFDGFDCKQVDKIPSTYTKFFKDEVYMSGSKYCYDFK